MPAVTVDNTLSLLRNFRLSSESSALITGSISLRLPTGRCRRQGSRAAVRHRR